LTNSIRFYYIALIFMVGFTIQPAAAQQTHPGQTHINSQSGATPMVIMTTSLGAITIELDAEKAPITVENFLKYVDDSFYDGTIFHRVIPNFMIQCGGMQPDMSEKDNNAPIKNEADNGLKNSRGTLAMARTQVVDSATSQFFINVNDNNFLDHGGRDFGYAVFGKVVDGLDVVDKIAAVETGMSSGHSDVPVDAVIIESIKRKE
jgi:cyclophilin family peptidyl-prolyl cis-trans isomerase